MEAFLIVLHIIWFFYLYMANKALRFLAPIEKFAANANPQAPLVSVVLAAKDAEDTLEKTVRSILSCSYPNMEIVIVNDRSKDRTEAIALNAAKDSLQVKTATLNNPEAGWIAKTKANDVGASMAKGDFLIFTDADIEFGEDLISLAVQAMEERKLDHLSVIGKVDCRGFMLKTLVSTSRILFTLSGRPWLAGKDKATKLAKGMGAFNMVRKRALEKAGGLKEIKMEIVDDVALAQLIAANGGKSNFFGTKKGALQFCWYETFLSMAKGLEKNIVGGFANYNLLATIGVCAAASLPLALGVLSAGAGIAPLTFYVGALGIFALLSKKLAGEDFWPVFSHPFGLFLLAGILLRAHILLIIRGGVWWGGVFYPLEELKKGSKVKLGL